MSVTDAVPLSDVRMHALLPQPRKILGCIAAADEIPEPNDVHVQFWVDGQLQHNYNTDDMEHWIPELIEFATTIMTLNSGDIIACGSTCAIRSSAHGRRACTWVPTRPILKPSGATGHFLPEVLLF
ncbi:MAG: fumarylacetoacetate hydrolase family protein [Pseudomonadota bacterium]